MKRAPQLVLPIVGAAAFVGIGFLVGRADGIVHLTAEKLAAADLKTDIAQGRPMALTRLVPARLQYDDRRHSRRGQ